MRRIGRFSQLHGSDLRKQWGHIPHLRRKAPLRAHRQAIPLTISHVMST